MRATTAKPESPARLGHSIAAPSGYKQAEAELIPEGWEEIDLSRLCTLQRGFDITEATRVPGTVPVYSSSGVSYFHNRAMVNPPGVVTGRKGILGKVFLVHEPFWPHDTTLWVKDFRGNHPAYVALVLQNFHLERLDAATSVPTLNRNNLVGHLVLLPPTTAEQRAIAEALSDVDKWLGASEALIAKKRAIKQAAMQQLLTGKTRLPGFSSEWEAKRLGSVAHIKTGSRNNEDKVEDGQYPFFVRSDVVERINSYSHDCEAILVPGEGRIGSIFHYIHGRFDVHQRVYAITRFGSTVSARFVHFYMAKNFGAWAMQNTVKATVDSLRLPTFQNFAMVMPRTIEEQSAIAAVLCDMDAEIAALERRRGKARAIKQGMMQQLLTGRVRLVKPEARISA